MKTTLLIISLILPLSLLAAASPAEIYSLIYRSIDLSIRHRYAEAEAAAREIIHCQPDSPAGWFFLSGVINSQMTDFEDYSREKEFFTCLDKTAAKAEAKSKSRRPQAWDYFYLGGAKGYKAFYHLRNERYLSALGEGISCINALEKALALDSTLYDAYLALGNYKYWISRKTQFLQWFPFIPDRREEGLQEVWKSKERGKFTHESAASALGWVLIDAGRAAEARAVAEEMLKKYPESRFFIYIKARAAFDQKDFKEALKIYGQLLKSVRSAEQNNHFNEMGILLKLIESHVSLGEWQKALNICDEALAIKLSPEMVRQKAKLIDNIKMYRELCLQRMVKVD